MGAPKHPKASLLPSGHSLDLFVTLTDYYGHHQLVQIHDPPLIHEREHHHLLHFSYRRRPSGEVESDFELDNAPASPSRRARPRRFPGAFPPARIVEMDEVVAQRRDAWPRRAAFIARDFQRHLRAGIDPTTASFIDGAVLNNRPFQEAISAIHGRPAYRQVDRRLVYIDPIRRPRRRRASTTCPGFFATLRGALSDIPRSQPVTDELGWVVNFNDQVRRLRSIIESARPQSANWSPRSSPRTFDRPSRRSSLRTWREQVNSQVARDAGFAYEAYVRLKLASVRAFGAPADRQAARRAGAIAASRVVAEIIDAWAVRKGSSTSAPTAKRSIRDADRRRICPAG